MSSSRGFDSSQHSFASYFAGRAIAERGFHPGPPEGAEALAASADVLIHRWDARGLKLACMVDREHTPQRWFSPNRNEVLDVVRRSLDAGAAHGQVQRASIEIFELGLPPASEDWSRLRQLRTSPKPGGIEISPWILVPATGRLWTTVPFGGFFAGRGFFREVMRGYRAAHPPR